MTNLYSLKARWLLSAALFIFCSFMARAQYCPSPPGFSSGNEPMTSVVFAGINNQISPIPADSSPYMDFTAISGTVQRGLSYTITVQGNTVEDGFGPYSNYYRIFIDWNDDGTFGTGESYDIVLPIVGSSGDDGEEVSLSIAVPITATLGSTTMRVVKKYNTYGTACNTSGFGQMHDYSLTVNAEPSCLPPTGLSISAVLSSTATLNWSASTSTGVSGYQYFVSQTNTAPTGAGTDATGVTSTPIGSLSPSTLYYVWMRTNCGGGIYSPWSSSISFTTACVASPAPFIEDFEGGVLPPCWTTTSSNPVATGLWKFTGAVDYDNGNTRDPGTFAWVDGSDPSTINDVTLISPVISLGTLTAPQLVFDYFSNNESTYANNVFKVDIYNGTTWVNLYTNNTNLNDWRIIEIPLTAYAGTNVQFRFVVDKTIAAVGFAFYNDILIDNVKIEQSPTCIKPTNLVATAANATTINLSWTASISTPAAGYEYYFSDTNTPPSAGTAGTDVPTGLTASITTALANTTYFVYVRADCGSGDLSAWTQAAVVTTPCAAFTVNFIEDFEGGVLPPCWATTSTAPTGNGLWKFAGFVEYDQGNTRDEGTFAWVDGSDPSNVANVTLISPPINLTGLTVPEIVFDYFSNNAGTYANNIFKVDIFNGTTWTNIYTNNTSLNDWRTISVQLPAYAGMTVQFRFVVDKTAATPAGNAFYNDILLDNVIVHEAPVCIAPTGVNLTGVTKFGATVNWTASSIAPSNNYDIYYSTSPTPPTTGTAANGGTAVSSGTVLSTLASSTTYYVWVRGNCGANGGSAWTPVATFTTLCDYPTITTANGATACGQGSVSLTGTASSGQLYWWSAETGGNLLGSGNTYATPTITATTNYYVSAASVIPNSTITLGTATQTSGSPGNSPYYHGYGGNKTQYIILASELHAAGIAPGPINSLTYTIATLGTDTFADFAVSIGATTQNVATATQISGLTPVYSNASETLVEGDNTYTFAAPFVWDGTSNIVVQTCYSNNNYGGTSSTVAYNTTSFVSATYTYADNQSAEDICAATTGAVGGSGGTYTASLRPNIKFNANGLCASPRQMVTATITNAVAITANASQPAICVGGSTTISASSTNANYAYTWMPGNLTGPSQTLSPAATTTYTVTATDSGTNCTTTADVTVTVNALPPAITVTPATAQACANVPVMLTATGNSVTANAAVGTGTITPGATDVPNPLTGYYGGQWTQMLYKKAELEAQGLNADSMINSIAFDLSAAEADAVENFTIRIGHTTVENMTAGFVPVTGLTTVYYEASMVPAAGVTGLKVFTFTAPFDWDGTSNLIIEVVHNSGTSGTTSGTVTKATATPFTSVYYLRVDLVAGGVAGFQSQNYSALTTKGALSNRPNAVFNYSYSLPVTWSPVTGLYTNAEGTTAYTGQPSATVYAMPSAAATYTATATNAATCISTDDAVLTPNGPNTPTGATSQVVYANTATDATIEDIVVAESGVIWYASQANAIAGISPLAAGTQVSEGTTYYGTLSTGSCVPLGVTITAILGQQGFDIANFKYYPNPVKDVFNVSYSQDITSVSVYNLLGQKVISKDINATEAQIDMSRLADGPYVVNVSSGNSVQTIKIIKKH